ncbi:hypothetical protein CPB86DRAFT_751952 [Serendipita vermifera]|nr:hypothetical protein CPB86DRAFT_751952 [Serendipita vermifera]
MERPEPTAGTKRTREESSGDSGNDDDDDVSLVSRSPSPKPPTADEMLRRGIHSYTRGESIEEEIATLETRIKKTNIGYSMLEKFGWKEGQGLGAHGTGRPDPIPFTVKNDQMGLGKANYDFAMIDATVAQRRDLASERQTRETDEQRQSREEAVAKQTAIKMEITDTLKPFYCQVCDKQYANVGQYNEHCNTYAHHHKVREKDLKESAKVGRESASSRMEKEKKREERELKKMAKAAGIKFSTPSVNVGHQVSADIKPLDSTKKSSGWAAVGSSATSKFAPMAPSEGEPKKGGWKSFSASSISAPAGGSGGWSRVGSTSLGPPAPLDPPPPIGTPPPLPSDSMGQDSINPPLPSGSPPPLPSETLPPLPTEPKPTRAPRSAPIFHSSGWTNLTHQLEERSVVDTNVDNTVKEEGHDGDHEMSYTPPTSKPTSPKNMVIDVDALYPPTPAQPSIGRHLPKTPAWRIHEAPSPSPRVGIGMNAAGNPQGYYSPIAGLSRGPHGRRNMDNSKPEQKEQPRRAWSPMNELSTAPPGWKRMGS